MDHKKHQKTIKHSYQAIHPICCDSLVHTNTMFWVYPSLTSEFQQKVCNSTFNSPVFTSFLRQFMVHGIWKLLGLPKQFQTTLPASHPLLDISQSFRVATKGHKCKRGKTESPKDMLCRACITGKPGYDYNGESTPIQFYTSTRTQHAMYINYKIIIN